MSTINRAWKERIQPPSMKKGPYKMQGCILRFAPETYTPANLVSRHSWWPSCDSAVGSPGAGSASEACPYRQEWFQFSRVWTNIEFVFRCCWPRNLKKIEKLKKKTLLQSRDSKSNAISIGQLSGDMHQSPEAATRDVKWWNTLRESSTIIMDREWSDCITKYQTCNVRHEKRQPHISI